MEIKIGAEITGNDDNQPPTEGPQWRAASVTPPISKGTNTKFRMRRVLNSLFA